MRNSQLGQELDLAISNLEKQQGELELKLSSLEDELGAATNEISIHDIKVTLKEYEEKKSRNENSIFQLKIKKSELSYIEKDNTTKNNLARNSMYASIVLTVILIVLTTLQSCSNMDMVAIEIINVLENTNLIKKEISLIQNKYEPLLQNSQKQEFQSRITKLNDNVFKVEQKLETLKSDYSKRIIKIESAQNQVK